MEFLKENWLYIAVPLALVLIAAAVVVFFLHGESNTSGFIYAF